MLSSYSPTLLQQNFNIQLLNKQLKIWLENSAEIITDIHLFMITGQTIYTAKTKTQQLVLGLATQPSGLYFGLLRTQNKLQYFKISIK